MISRLFGRFRAGRIQRKMALLIMAITTGVLVLFGLYQYHEVKTEAEAELNNLARLAIQRLSESLALPLWQFEVNYVEKTILAEMADLRIQAVQVAGTGGILKIAKTRDENGNLINATGDTVSGPYTRSSEVKWEERTVGTVSVSLSDRLMAARLAGEIRKLTVTVLLLDLCLLTSIILVMRRSVIRPVARVITELGPGADRLSEASGEVARASQSLAEGTAQQAASLEETSASLEELATMIKRNADHTAEVDRLIAREANPNFDRIRKDMTEMEALIEAARTSGDEMAKIIKSIDEIAFQTNLLALNAAVEAARAGESGAGFAVVAGEVRNLAMRAAQASGTTNELIEQVGKKNDGVQQMNRRVVDALKQNIDIARRVSDRVSEVAVASRQQAEGIDQLTRAMSEMDRVIQRNASISEESAAAAEDMNGHAEQMNRITRSLTTIIGGNDKKFHRVKNGGIRKPEKPKQLPNTAALSED